MNKSLARRNGEQTFIILRIASLSFIYAIWGRIEFNFIILSMVTKINVELEKIKNKLKGLL